MADFKCISDFLPYITVRFFLSGTSDVYLVRFIVLDNKGGLV